VVNHVSDYLAGYLDGQLSDSEMVAVRRHLQSCAACRAELDAVQRIRQELAELMPLAVRDIHPPQHNWRRIDSALHEAGGVPGAKRRGKVKQSGGRRPSLLITGFSLAVISLMIVVFVSLIRGGEEGPGSGAPTEPTATPLQTIEPTEIPQPTPRLFDLSQDEAFAHLASILAGDSSGDPLVNRHAIQAQDSEVEVTEDQRYGQRFFIITTIRHATDRPLPEGETVTIGGMDVVLRTGLSGTVTLTGDVLHDGSGEVVGSSGSMVVPEPPSEIAYEDGVLIAWNDGDRQLSVLTNLTVDDAVAMTRTLISDDDRRAVDGTEPLAGEPVALVTDPVDDLSPGWSPDGQQIVFASERVPGYRSLFTIQVDGDGLTQLTDGAGNDFMPAWSPDGSRIAFGTYRHGQGNGDLYLMDPDGSNLMRLTTDPAYDGEPVWSPDGTRIAFYSDRDGGRNIYVIDADGDNLSRLTDGPGHQQDPVWSPDETRIAYIVWEDSGDSDIYLMNADGSGQVQLTSGPASDHSPAWSPDGSHLAFSSERNGQTDVYVIDVDNPDEEVRLTWHAAQDYAPAWSPDGRWIAFSTDRSGNFDLYLAAPDGSGVLPLVTSDLDEYFPSWSPDGAWIVYTAGRSHVMSQDIYLVPITLR
jgi:Tol biopolymer transport system component